MFHFGVSGMRDELSSSTIVELLNEAAERFGSDVAIECQRVLTFAQLRSVVRLVASGLGWDLGIRHGDRVAIWAPNRWEWVVAALAIHSVGGVLVPINTRYKGPEARFILEKSGAKLLFTVDDFMGMDFDELAGGVPSVVFGSEGWRALLMADARKVLGPTADDLSDILFTSGTTGQPKGVMTTHAQSLAAYWSWSEVVGLRRGDRYLVVAPFFHCFGYKAGWLACLMRGATILPQPTFDVDAVLERIPRDSVSVLPGPPALYQTFLQRDLSGHDLSSLRLAVTGAATIPVRLIERMRAPVNEGGLGFDTVITGYGLTEATGIATMCRFDDDPETIARTSGRAIPNVEVKVVGAEGESLPAGEPGHVLVRGYNVMKGYFDEPEQTAETVVDGWLSTGDVGILDERGYLRITDRIKDMFIVGGFNAYPAEIEHALMEHPGVREVAVIGMPDARLGEVGCAFVAGDVTEEALIAWSRDQMANFKVPRKVVLVEALPRNASTKVQKFKLREMLRG